MNRIAQVFARLERQGRAGFIPFIMGGDPSFDISLKILRGLPKAGADIVEIGVAFTDPMADGKTIQAAGLRALSSGQTLSRTLDLVHAFRQQNTETPIVLMGYFNPFQAYGVERFVVDAIKSGVDGVIVVDLPPEEDAEMCIPAIRAGLSFIRLATPTTDAARLPSIVKHASSFIYYVSVAGVTGGNAGETVGVKSAVSSLQKASNLPVAVGFGINSAKSAAETAEYADAVVVGSALVDRLYRSWRQTGLEKVDGNDDIVISDTLKYARELADAVHGARGDR